MSDAYWDANPGEAEVQCKKCGSVKRLSRMEQKDGYFFCAHSGCYKSWKEYRRKHC